MSRWLLARRWSNDFCYRISRTSGCFKRTYRGSLCANRSNFCRRYQPEPTTPDDPTADALPNPIEQVLFRTIDQSGNTSDLTVGISYTAQYETTDPTQPETLRNAVDNFLGQPRISEKFPGLKSADYVIKTFATDKVASALYLPDGSELTSVMLLEPQAAWIRVDSVTGSFDPSEPIAIDELLVNTVSRPRLLILARW